MTRNRHTPTARRCPVHGSPVRDTVLCEDCVTSLEKNLGDLPGLAEDLDLMLSRQTSSGDRVGARSKEQPLPFDGAASREADRVRKMLTGWLWELQAPQCADIAAASRWLLSNVPRLRLYSQAHELAADIAGAVHSLRHVVDHRPERWFAGPCETSGCVEDDPSRVGAKRPSELYASPSAKTVRCRRCGVRYDVDERRSFLLDAAQDQLAHAELIGRAAPALGVEITPAAVRNYADRGRIVAHGVDRAGHPLYRVGDVIDVARDVLARRAEQAEKSRRKAEAKSARRAS